MSWNSASTSDRENMETLLNNLSNAGGNTGMVGGSYLVNFRNISDG